MQFLSGSGLSSDNSAPQKPSVDISLIQRFNLGDSDLAFFQVSLRYAS